MKLTVGQLLQLAGAVGQILTKNNVLDAAGNFVSPLSIDNVAVASIAIEDLLKTAGLQVDGKIDTKLHAVPAILALLGI